MRKANHRYSAPPHVAPRSQTLILTGSRRVRISTLFLEAAPPVEGIWQIATCLAYRNRLFSSANTFEDIAALSRREPFASNRGFFR